MSKPSIGNVLQIEKEVLLVDDQNCGSTFWVGETPKIHLTHRMERIVAQWLAEKHGLSLLPKPKKVQ